MSEQDYPYSLLGRRLPGAAGARDDEDGTIVRRGVKSESLLTRQGWCKRVSLGGWQQQYTVPRTGSFHCELGLDLYLRATGERYFVVLSVLVLILRVDMEM